MSIVTAIRKAYFDSKPLTSAQLHYLWMNRNRLAPGLEAVARYYLDGSQFSPKTRQYSFIKPRSILSLTDIENLRRRLTLMLNITNHGIQISLTPAQFMQLKNSLGELLFLHGNQVLTGAPFFPGGVPHVDFFQWGNLMGVVK